MAFTGRAIYDTGVWDGVAEDVSDIISNISPFETPLLDALGDGERPATSVFHEWLEESLNPSTIVSSTTLVNSTGVVNLAVHNGSGGIAADYLMIGAIFQVAASGEYVQVSAIAGNTLTVTRAFAGTTVATLLAGGSLFLISDAALEGADVTQDISRPRVRKYNYCQIFKKDIIISGTELAVTHIGVSNEWDHQVTARTREMLRDFEKTVIRGKLSGNSIGSASVYRTMRGIWDYISTNVTTSNTLTPNYLNDTILRSVWDSGAGDADWIICDANVKQVIDRWNESRVRVTNPENRFRNRVTEYESTYGVINVMLNRWMPSNSLMVISTDRINVMPLQGRSFRAEEVSRTGDSRKGMVYGEYTLELRNEEGMAKFWIV